jgi:hypothetical protein
VSPAAPVPVVAGVPLPLTDAEQDLRRRAAELAASTSPFADTLPPATGDVTLYAARLIATPMASAEARFARLGDDIASDRVRLAQFVLTAGTVAARDRIRNAAQAYVVPSPAEGAALAQRVAGNGAIIQRTFNVLHARSAAYRFALDHLVLATPSPGAVPVERALAAFDRALATPLPDAASDR